MRAALLLLALFACGCRDKPKPDVKPPAAPSSQPSALVLDPSVLGPVRSRAGGEPSPVSGSPGGEAAFEVGAPADARDYRMTVLRTRPCKVEPHFAPRDGHMKLGVEVELVGKTDREVPVSAFYAELSDAAGNTYRPTLAGCTPVLPSERLREGESVKGFITFELPIAARDLSLRYQPFVVGSGEQRLTFTLGPAGG